MIQKEYPFLTDEEETFAAEYEGKRKVHLINTTIGKNIYGACGFDDVSREKLKKWLSDNKKRYDKIVLKIIKKTKNC